MLFYFSFLMQVLRIADIISSYFSCQSSSFQTATFEVEVDETLHFKPVFYVKNVLKLTCGNQEFHKFPGEDPGSPLQGGRVKGRRERDEGR